MRAMKPSSIQCLSSALSDGVGCVAQSPFQPAREAETSSECFILLTRRPARRAARFEKVQRAG